MESSEHSQRRKSQDRKSRESISPLRSPRSGENSESQTHALPIFILNRSGLTKEELSTAFQEFLDKDINADDVEEEFRITVSWVSLFGKYPDQPHALVIITNSDAAADIISEGYVNLNFKNEPLVIEIDRCDPSTPKQNNEPTKVHISNVPTHLGDKLTKEISDFLYPIADVKNVIIPKNFKKKKEIFVELFDKESAGYVVRVAMITQFRGNLIRCTFAKKRQPRNQNGSNSNNSNNSNNNSNNSNNSNKNGKKKNYNKKNYNKKHFDKKNFNKKPVKANAWNNAFSALADKN